MHGFILPVVLLAEVLSVMSGSAHEPVLPKVRFAPSPTGKLHVGNVRSAIFNCLFARKSGGQCILRLDDTDTQRSSDEFASAIIRDLTWLGLTFHSTTRQSDRTAYYAAAFEQLLACQRVYPCFESEQELADQRMKCVNAGRPPIYNRRSMRLTPAEITAKTDEGPPPHWRFRLSSGSISFDDLIRGTCVINPATLSDPIIRRADGTWLYTFTSVVDDIDMGISHVIRGEDHVTNTVVQIDLFQALGVAAPGFAHHNLLISADGKALSKRDGSLSVEHLRNSQLEPRTILTCLATLGTSQSPRPDLGIVELTNAFQLTNVSRVPARFDPDEIERFNASILATTPTERVTEYLSSISVPEDLMDRFWQLIRSNISVLPESELWWKLLTFRPDFTPDITSNQTRILGVYQAILPACFTTLHDVETWLKAVRLKTTTGGKALFLPLRLALTGQEHGPAIADLVFFMGADTVRDRLTRILSERSR